MRGLSEKFGFPMYELGTQRLVDVYRRVGNDLGCMYILLQTESVESVVSYCCLCTVVFYNLRNVYDAAVVLYTKNSYLQDRQLITPSTKHFLERLRKRVQRVRKDIAGDWVLHHHNAPVHTAFSIREFLTKKNIPTLQHPPYSPDLAPCAFYLSPKLTSKLKGHHFETVTDELITLTENDFWYCYDQWKERWNQCVTSQGSYFEGDNL
jgi:hypothetical protein